MYHFYYDYRFGDHSLLAKKLGISTDQLEPLHKYTEYLASINTNTYYGTGISKTVEGGIALLEKYLPIQLATRSLALYNLKFGKTCASYFG